ncbi:DMT family transporter [Acuticoccus kandeliae]|uniref:DMT family transporter n=1 Tax=Acuticoccus kandeliae TaxID=2073160 RepID=UPI000D3E3DB8|nr:DMT family transporter [Acuticoccus kandeliae]
MNARHPAAIEYVLLGVLALLWGSAYLFVKVALSEIPPLSLVMIRVVVAALFLAVIMQIRGERLPRDPHVWRMLFTQSWFNAIGAWILVAYGQQRVDAGLASVLNSTSPIFVVLITVLVLRTAPPRPLQLAGVAVGLCGVVLIVGPDALLGLGDQVAGQLACLGGAALYACSAIYGRRFVMISPAATALGTLICGSAVLVPLAFLAEAPWTLRPSATALGAALMLAIGSTGIALLIYFRLVRSLGSMGVASQAYLRAGLGVLLGVVVLGESVDARVGIGLAAAVLGVILINWRGGGASGPGEPGLAAPASDAPSRKD